MPRVKLTDHELIVEIESENWTTSMLLSRASEVMDRKRVTGCWSEESDRTEADINV